MFPINRGGLRLQPWAPGSYETGSSVTLTAGIHIPAKQLLTICMIGGGGSGGTGDGHIAGDVGGGHGGTIVNNTVTLSYGESITITIGTGGAGIASQAYTNKNGNAGTATIFGGYFTASGGAGGYVNPSGTSGNYQGDAGSRSTCYGTFYDGTAPQFVSTWGGQAGFANGTDGAYPANSTAGSKGSGSGGVKMFDVTQYSGAGGNGWVKINWS
jgi:Glycine-rich domain